jgi:hypothetical protein
MTIIRCILGRISSPSPGVTVSEDKTKANSSKWIFDIEQRGSREIEIVLLNFLGGKPRPPGVAAPQFCPLNQQAAESLIWFPDPDKLTIQISTDDAEDGHAFFRVTIDALHSLMR